MTEPTRPDDSGERQDEGVGLLVIDCVFVINLDRRPDRLRAVYEALPPEVRGRVQRVRAVDGRELRPTPEIRHFFRGNDFDYRRGTLACALSHYQLWQRIADPGYRLENALILEDDVIFNPGFVRRWNAEHARNLPDPYDLIYLGGPAATSEYAETLTLTTSEFRLPSSRFIAARTHRHFGVPVLLGGRGYGTFSYLLTKDGARRLCRLAEQAGMCTAVDQFLWERWQLLRVYTAIPLLCWSIINNASDIQQDNSVLF